VERDALSALAALLRELGIRWVLIGALAANRYRASPRLTQDVDLLLADAGPGIEVLESAARAAGWDVRRASPEGDLLRLRHPEHGIADLLIAGTDYQHEAIRRAREEPIGNGEHVAVLTVEDVIVHKLIAWRTQDRADIEAILAAGTQIDDRYVERWAAFWDVLGAWRKLRSGDGA
jgi:predicted nucleotidyltransferase